jgi:predicted porin
MKVRILASVVLGASCSYAAAQSSTTAPVPASTPVEASSVFVYGAIDLGVASISNVAGLGRVTGLQNGGLGSSRLGFKGSDALGGGNSINFQLEADVLADVGSAGTGPLFGRAAWVGASGAWGEVRLGRNYTETYELAAKYDPMTGGNFGGLIAVFDSAQSAVNPTSGNLFASYGNTRVDNSVHYRTRSMGGLVTRLTYSAGEKEGSSKTNSQLSGAFDFARGPWEAALVYGQAYSGTTEQLLFRHRAAYLRYTARLVRLVAGHTESIGLGAGGGKFVTNFVGANVPVATQYILNAFYALVDNQVLDRQPRTWTLRADYLLSKRTTLYAGYAASRQDNGSRLNLVNLSKFTSSSGAGNQPNAGDNQTGFMVGLRHAF